MNIHNFLLSTTMLLILCGTTVADVKDRMVQRREIEAAVWGMRIINFLAMRDGLPEPAVFTRSWQLPDLEEVK